MIKFFLSIILVQVITGVLIFAMLNASGDLQLILILLCLVFMTAFLFAFWLVSIAKEIHNQDQTFLIQRHMQDRETLLKQAEREKQDLLKEAGQMQEVHAREREAIKLSAEQEKAKILAESYEKIERESRRIQARANLKVGVACAAAAAAGGIMIVSQLVTIGLMVLVASGSGLSGYILRTRHEKLAHKEQHTKLEKL